MRNFIAQHKPSLSRFFLPPALKEYAIQQCIGLLPCFENELLNAAINYALNSVAAKRGVSAPGDKCNNLRSSKDP